jgi:hypothetical protein
MPQGIFIATSSFIPVLRLAESDSSVVNLRMLDRRILAHQNLFRLDHYRSPSDHRGKERNPSQSWLPSP